MRQLVALPKVEAMTFLILLAVWGAQWPHDPAPDFQPRVAPLAQHRNLAVYPIYDGLGAVRDSDYITLDEGLKAGTVTVSEKGASVPIRRPIPQPRTPNPPTPVQQEYQGGGAEVNT